MILQCLCQGIMTFKIQIYNVEFAFVLKRSLVEYLPDFKGHHIFVLQHIPSDYDEEMSQKSVVVYIQPRVRNANYCVL